MTNLILCILTSASTTMLFVGNSYTMGNGGLWTMTENIYESVTGDTLVTLQHTQGGATLQDHWNNQSLREMIQTQSIDIAIFQEQSCMPVIGPAMTYEYGDSLALLCTAYGTQPAFLMTWARKNDFMMLKGLEAGYSRMGYEHQCPVAPCGIGFHLLQGDYALLELYESDGAHPSEAGSYLAACIIALSVLQADLSCSETWHSTGLSPASARVIREAAIEACSLYTQPMEAMK